MPMTVGASKLSLPHIFLYFHERISILSAMRATVPQPSNTPRSAWIVVCGRHGLGNIFGIFDDWKTHAGIQNPTFKISHDPLHSFLKMP